MRLLGTAPASSTARVLGTTQATASASDPLASVHIGGAYTGSGSTIAATAAGGVQKIREGLKQAASVPSADAVDSTAFNLPEGILKVGAGASEVLSAPLAPLFSPIGKLIGYVSDKLANHPAVQSFANSAAGNATSRVAEDVANATEVAGVIAGSKGSAPVESALNKAAAKTADTTGSVAAQALGATTGAGAESVRAAFRGSPAFTDALRGKIDPEQVIQTAQNAVQNISESRRTSYLSGLEDLSKQKTSLDISPIQQTLDEKLASFGIKKDTNGNLNFSRSSIANNGSARADVQGIYDTLRTWGTQKGDRTPIGLDILKKQLGDFYSPSGSARALVQAVKGKVGDILQTQVPGYAEMTAGYQSASALLEDIKSATSIGGKAKADAIFTKLTTALKADKQFRIEMLKEMQAKGSQPNLIDQIAGLNMSSAIPKGLVGKGADIGAAFAILGHYFDPHYIPMILATSPRVVAEFARVLGMPKESISAIVHAVNRYGAKAASGGAAAAPQASQSQAQTQ